MHMLGEQQILALQENLGGQYDKFSPQSYRSAAHGVLHCYKKGNIYCRIMFIPGGQILWIAKIFLVRGDVISLRGGSIL